MPTPVGPRKTNEPIGRRGSFRSARERRSALQMATTASSWPMTRCFACSLSIARSFCGFVLLHALERNAGPLGDDVHDVVLVDDRLASLRVARAIRSRMRSSFSLACFSLSRSAAAFSKSCSLIAASFSTRISSISASMSLTSGGRVIAPMRAREPASSITSMALSGRKRPVI